MFAGCYTVQRGVTVVHLPRLYATTEYKFYSCCIVKLTWKQCRADWKSKMRKRLILGRLQLLVLKLHLEYKKKNFLRLKTSPFLLLVLFVFRFLFYLT